MNIIFLHGDNEKKVGERLHKFVTVAKKRSWDILQYDKTGNSSLSEMLVSTGLFEQGKLVLVENINSLKKRDFEWLDQENKKVKANLVIYNMGNVAKGKIKKLPKDIKVEEYKIPVTLWRFLDTFTKGNSKNNLLLFHQTVQKEAVEFVFALLAKRVRNMLLILISEDNISLPVWRKGKLKRQAENFTQEELIDIYEKLGNLDILAKTSRTDLTSEISSLIALSL